MAANLSNTNIQNGVYGVLGCGIDYSQSPRIFRAAFEHLNWPAVYGLFDLPPRRIGRFLHAAADAGIVGLSVTKPYKERVIEYCDELDERADWLGAVNAIAIRGRKLYGYNTDIAGIDASLAPYRRTLARGDAVIFGAGGVARALVWTLLTQFRLQRITVVARQRRKAARLLHDIGFAVDADFEANACGWNDRNLRDDIANAALVANATPFGTGSLKQNSPLPARTPLVRETVCFDLVYRPTVSPFLRQARRARCHAVIDGWPMLVAQAAEAFRLWTGRPFPVAVRDQLLRDGCTSR
jgi:shikimate dehydrogenase